MFFFVDVVRFFHLSVLAFHARQQQANTSCAVFATIITSIDKQRTNKKKIIMKMLFV